MEGNRNRVSIIGAGLAGSLLAIYLAKRGITADVYEARGDMRKETVAAGRSINLALSDRGIAALREVGMDAYMLAEAVPMLGRMIHTVSGETKLLPYSGRSGEYINSISRGGLNIALINEAEKYEGVTFYFNHKCIDHNIESNTLRFEKTENSKLETDNWTEIEIGDGDTVIATDGAGSAIRQAMEAQLVEFSSTSVFLEHGYKELHIPPGDNDSFLIEKNALHIWPRHQFMMIALPNFDGSFTCTLFLAHKGRNTLPADRVSGFDSLADPNAVLEFFNREFPDVVPLMPTLAEDFAHNPIGNLGTVKCHPWNAGGKVLLLGDAAHAVVPFYGQGMNCAFEDVRVLGDLLSEPGAIATGSDLDWNSIFDKFVELRKPNADAIADMAVENFYEMRDRVADPVFQRKRELETKLEQTYPDYFSKYSMVTFREDLPYAEAKSLGNAQDELLMQLSADVASVSDLDLDNVHQQIVTLHERLR